MKSQKKKRNKIFNTILIVGFMMCMSIYFYGSLNVYAAENTVLQNTPRASTKSGEWIKGENGKWWYKHEDGSYSKNAWEYINGKWYHFDANGWMQTGWIRIGEKWYYLASDGAMVTGWIELDGKWYYLKENGEMSVGWTKITYNSSDEWFFFFDNGVMNKQNMTDVVDENTRTLYFRSDGVWLYTTALLPWDLVDSGKHLDWGGNSRFISFVEEAASKWNAYKAGVIRKDSMSILEDVTISDYYEVSTTRAVTSARGTIRFNTYLMSLNEDENKTLKTVMHELGHALGLAHNDKSDIMYANSSTVTELTKNDKKSYDEAYKKY